MILIHGKAQLSIEQYGTGSGDALLMHAGVTDQRSWTPLVDLLAGHTRCVSFDRRGFGRTVYEAEDGWSPVTDAVAVLDGTGVDRAVVIGASMGGRSALDLVLTHPERASGLILIGAAISGAPPPVLDPEVRRLDEQGDAALERGDLAEVNRIEAHVWLDGPLVAEGRVGGPVRDLFLEMNAAALAAADPGEEDRSIEAWDRLGEIAVPTLVLVGEHDLRHVRDNARHLAAGIAGARLVELAGVAHLPHFEADPATLREIEAFVRVR
jgi:pimeloyl-ACP methyl ester carboxylesterase